MPVLARTKFARLVDDEVQALMEEAGGSAAEFHSRTIESAHLIETMFQARPDLLAPMLGRRSRDVVLRALWKVMAHSPQPGRGEAHLLGRTGMNVLERAARIAKEFGHTRISCEHIVVALLRDFSTARTLRQVGIVTSQIQATDALVVRKLRDVAAESAVEAKAEAKPDETPDTESGADDEPFIQLTQSGLFGPRRDVIVPLVQELLMPFVDRSLHITDCRQMYAERKDDGRLHILYNANVYGAKLPSGEGVPVVLSSGQIVGELHGKHLVLYENIVTTGTLEEIQTLIQILRVARDQFALNTFSANNDSVTRQFSGECLNQIAAAGEPEPTAQRQLEQLIDYMDDLERTARQIESDAARDARILEAQLEREYDDILTMENIRDVRVSGGQLIVETDTIYCTDPRTNKVHELGRFEIHFELDAPNRVKFLNQTRTIGDAHAPHVGPGGHPCLGTVKEIFPGLVARRELVSAVQVAIAFLESVNVNDVWGSRINQFPQAHPQD